MRDPLFPPPGHLRLYSGDMGVAWGCLSCPAPHEEGVSVWAAPSALGGAPHLDGADGAAPTVQVQARLQPGQWWRTSASHLARERGLWFYYAAGCSDMYNRMGSKWPSWEGHDQS